MKPSSILLSSCCALALLALTNCEKKATPAQGSLKEKIDDALDRRPNEKIKDAIEDINKDAKDISKSVNKAAKEMREDLKKEAESLSSESK